MDIQQSTQHTMEIFDDLEVVFQNFCLNDELEQELPRRTWEIWYS